MTSASTSWDLHCDLPMYLVLEGSAATDARCPCNLNELALGGIQHQVCAIFSFEHPIGVEYALSQAKRLKEVQAVAGQTALSWALEGAVGIFPKHEAISQGFERFDGMVRELGPCAYCCLTWNGACSLGGGAHSDEGITTRGREVVRGLIQRGIPIDFSHTGDQLAKELLEMLDQEASAHPVLASHSNIREVYDHPRNLPTWLFRELMARGGLIGMNWVRPFVGNSAGGLLKHVERLLNEGGEASLASGADLFDETIEMPPDHSRILQPFFPDLNRGRHMRDWRGLVESEFGADVAEGMFALNPKRFFGHLCPNSSETTVVTP